VTAVPPVVSKTKAVLPKIWVVQPAPVFEGTDELVGEDVKVVQPLSCNGPIRGSTVVVMLGVQRGVSVWVEVTVGNSKFPPPSANEFIQCMLLKTFPTEL